MDKLKRFAELYQAPEFVLPYISFFLAEEEIEIILTLGQDKLSFWEVATRLDKNEDEARLMLEELYQKHVLNREDLDGKTVYSIGDFYQKLDYQCKFGENYLEMDKNIRNQLDQWCYEIYREKMLPYIEKLRRKEEVERSPETYELVEEFYGMIDSTQEIRLIPCNCRKLAQNCDKPTGTCMGFDSSITDRTGGQPLTKEEAKEIVRLAHKKGLMHQINSDWRINGPVWMCNCCSCCCYPTRLALELGSVGVFPVVQYKARQNEDTCTHCGVCTKRCNFSAFFHDGTEVTVNGKIRKQVSFDEQKCWGCGLCESTCLPKAITMEKI